MLNYRTNIKYVKRGLRPKIMLLAFCGVIQYAHCTAQLGLGLQIGLANIFQHVQCCRNNFDIISEPRQHLT